MTDTQPPTPDLDTIQARTDAATHGPWNTDARHPKYIFGADGPVVARTGINPAADADAAFIAHARTDVPALIAYARHLEARVASLEAERDGWAEAGRNESRILAARVVELEQQLAAAPLAEWAAPLADDNLEPYDGTLTLSGDDQPFARIHLAFRTDMDDDDRAKFLTTLGRTVLRAL